MPNRPRSHELEDESKRKFGDALPTSWLFREKSHDYGIDGEVEIFDEKGNTTGRLFYVQLKATDEKDIRKALKIKFKVTTFEYYSSLTLPVLIVRYHKPTHTLYARWAHSKPKKRAKKAQHNFTFYMDEKDDLKATFSRLKSDLNEYFLLRSSTALNIPIKLRLQISQELRSQGHSLANILLAFDEYEKRSGNKLILLNKEWEEGQLGNAICYQDGTTIYLGGGSASITFGDLSLFSKNLNHFIYEFFLNLGCLIVHYGQTIAANKIFLGIFRDCPQFKLGDPRTTIVLKSFTDASLFDEAIELIQTSINHESFDALQIALIFLRKQQDSEEKFPSFLLKAQRILRNFLENKNYDRSTLGILNYNEGNLLRSMKQAKESIKFYSKARKLRDEYSNESYFWGELAGSLFLCHRYNLSFKCYKKAIDLSPGSAKLWPLYADAAMFAGNYKEANIWFKKYLKKAKVCDPEWTLKSFFLDYLVDDKKIPNQNRKPLNASKLVQTINDEDIDSIESVLALDQLYSPAWAIYGDLLAKQEHKNSMYCYLWAAIIWKGDFVSWANAFFLSMYHNEMHLNAHIFRAAYRINGHVFLKCLYDTIEQQVSKDVAENMKNDILQLKMNIDSSKDNSNPIEIRFIEPHLKHSILF